jgi:WD40 repeat protein/serine/threonine protein kinase
MSQSTSKTESRLSELIAAYLEAIEAGARMNRERILADHPDLADRLLAFFDDYDRMLTIAGAHSINRGESAHSPVRPHKGQNGREDGRVSPRPFGKYDLLEEIGRGGMGVIYRARQRSPNRIVALKMIRSSRLASREDVERFYSEAETIAGLEHPGIVSVFEVGEHEDQHFYSMPYIEGLSLGDLMAEEGLVDPRAAAELVHRVADAIAYAHERGVIHRDLKPANILLSRSPAREGVLLTTGGARDHYDPRVADFGLAKRIESDLNLTGTGQVLGTPSYMPPEQAAGNTEEIGPLSDVYSLGAVLYCLLTGRPPFQSASLMVTLQQVIHDDPVPPRQVNSAVPRDLETACLKCLEKDPARRYASARELADDLRRFRDGETLIARPTGQLERAWKWTRRRPTAATLVVVGLVAVMALVGLTVSYSYQVERERLLYHRGVSLAYQSWQDNEITRAQELLAECPSDLRGWEWDYVERLCHTGLATSIKTPHAVPDSVTYDRYGKYLASGDRRGPVHVWDAGSGDPVMTLHGHTSHTGEIDFSPDGRRLASGGGDGTVRIWSLETRSELHALTGHREPVLGVAFSPDGRRVVSGGEDGTLRLWDVDDGTEQVVVEEHASIVNSVAFSFDGQFIATGNSDGTIRLWSAEDLTELAVLNAHQGDVNDVVFSPDDLRLASAGDDGAIRLWNVPQRHVILTCEGHAGPVKCLCFSPDGNRLASGGMDRGVRIWDATTGQVTLTFKVHTYRVMGVAFHPDGSHVASAGNVNNIQILRVGSGREAGLLEGHPEPVQSLAFHPEGNLLASAGQEGRIRFWHPQTSQCVRDFEAHEDRISALAFSPSGRLLASASHDRTIRTWEVPSGRLVRVFRGHTGNVYGVSFSPDGDRLVSASHDGTAIIWDVENGRKRVLTRGAGPVTSAVFSPDGSRLAVGGWDAVVAVWDLDDESSPPRALTGHTREVLSVGFSPDGSRLVSGDRGGNVLVWRTRTGRTMATLAGHPAPVSSVFFTPEGDRVASSSWDGSVRVWDIQSSHETLSLNGRNGRVYCAAFSPDGRRLATANHDGTLTLWGR